MLASLTEPLSADDMAAYDGDDLEALARIVETEGSDTLLGDVVRMVRGLVAALRVSGQRREAFEQILNHGNALDLWKDAPKIWKEWWVDRYPEGRDMCSQVELPMVQLLRDVVTRWSSTYLMIHRFLELYPVRFYSTLLR